MKTSQNIKKLAQDKERARIGLVKSLNYYYDGKGLSQEPQFARGNLTKVSSSVSETKYTSFDNLGRLLASQQISYL